MDRVKPGDCVTARLADRWAAVLGVFMGLDENGECLVRGLGETHRCHPNAMAVVPEGGWTWSPELAAHVAEVRRSIAHGCAGAP